MLVTTAMVGGSCRNEPSDSSASATRYSPLAERAFEPKRVHLAADHRRRIEPGRARARCATIEVVVVLPCEPAMAMPYFRRISSASISARGMTGMLARARLQHLGVVAPHRARR